MPRLLVVHHTASPALDTLLTAVLDGAGDPALDDVEVVVRAALAATAVDVLGADGYVLGSPVNLGYLSGALKHFFDQVYYPCLADTVGRPFGAYLHGNDDVTGARHALDVITTGLQWRRVSDDVEVRGGPTTADVAACRELGGVVAATLLLDADAG